MPSRPRKPCSQPGCSKTTANGGPCDAHRRQREARRKEDGNDAYRTTRWQRVRRAYLYDHPWCLLCTRAATVADHFPKSRRELLAEGVSNPDESSRLRPLCSSCHNKETARLQPGGFVASNAKPVIKLWPTDAPGG